MTFILDCLQLEGPCQKAQVITILETATEMFITASTDAMCMAPMYVITTPVTAKIVMSSAVGIIPGARVW